jgi:hypothetical protein
MPGAAIVLLALAASPRRDSLRRPAPPGGSFVDRNEAARPPRGDSSDGWAAQRRIWRSKPGAEAQVR